MHIVVRRGFMHQSRTERLWWWGAVAAAIVLALKLAAAFWAIRQGTEALHP